MKDQLLRNLHLVLILYAGFMLYTQYEEHTAQIEKLTTEIETVKIKTDKAKKDLVKIEKFKEQVGNFKKRVEEINTQIDKVQKQLPTDVNDTVVQQMVGNVARDLRIVDPTPAPGKEQLNGFYFAKEYNFSGKGTFLQLLVLLEQLEKSERILNVKSLTFDKPDKFTRSRFQVLQAKVTLESYRYNSKFEQKSGIDEIQSDLKNKKINKKRPKK